MRACARATVAVLDLLLAVGTVAVEQEFDDDVPSKCLDGHSDVVMRLRRQALNNDSTQDVLTAMGLSEVVQGRSFYDSLHIPLVE